MNELSRIVWSEGMHLGPHHFQAQNRYFENLVRFTWSALSYAPWGLAGLQLDGEALRNGLLRVVHAKGVFPDGLVFLIPEPDAPPADRPLPPIFPPTRDSLDVFLAIEPISPQGSNCDLEATGESRRYRAVFREVVDELTGQDAKSIGFAAKNLMVLVESEIGERQAIPLARIRRDSAGHYTQDEKFIPAAICLQASPWLMEMLRRLVEVLEDKARTMAKPKDLGASAVSGFSIEGISNAWFLHCVNSALGPLRHLMLTKNAHPEELYAEMARLGGALCTFGLESHPSQLPLYDHEHPTECFAALDHHIRTHLELVVPSNCVRIELAAGAPHFWSGAVTDARMLVHSQWIIGVRCRIGESEVISGVPRLLKVCSQEFVPKLVARALPGMTLRHLPVPPPAVNARVDFQYFAIDKAGPCWEHIMQTKRVGVYAPGELPDPDLDLMVILES